MNATFSICAIGDCRHLSTVGGSSSKPAVESMTVRAALSNNENGSLEFQLNNLLPADYKNQDKKDLNWRSNSVGVNNVAVSLQGDKWLNVWCPFARKEEIAPFL